MSAVGTRSLVKLITIQVAAAASQHTVKSTRRQLALAQLWIARLFGWSKGGDDGENGTRGKDCRYDGEFGVGTKEIILFFKVFKSHGNINHLLRVLRRFFSISAW